MELSKHVRNERIHVSDKNKRNFPFKFYIVISFWLKQKDIRKKKQKDRKPTKTNGTEIKILYVYR
jgi:hypothetical protein